MDQLQLLLWMWISCCYFVICSGGINDIDVIYGYEDPSKNIVKNWDFEDDFNADNSDWSVTGAQYKFSGVSYTGSRSIRIYDQDATERFTGVTQLFTGIKAKKLYYLSAFFKFADNPTATKFFSIRFSVSYRDSGNAIRRHTVGRFPAIRKSGNWRQLGGDFTPIEDTDELRLEVELSDNTIEYLMDTVSLIELDEWDPQWEKKANAEISRNRQNMVTLNMRVPNSAVVPACQMKLKLYQTKLHFGIGSAIRADPFNEETTFGGKYRKFFADKFEWGVYENDMKWKPMEATEGSPKYSRVDNALLFLEEHNISLRGHSVLWSLKEANPTWVQDKTGAVLWEKVNARVSSVVKKFKGKLIHWDVLNEYLHGKFYTGGVDDIQFIDKIHRKVRALDPDVELYLNDYEALRSGEYTSALADLGNELISRNVPVDGIGIQGHLRTIPVSPQRIKKRLEICTNTGLPVTITELSIHNTDVNLRAWQVNVLFKMAFANPKVAGVVFWGFSDLKKIGFLPEETALFTGEDFVPNQAGAVLLKLIRAWRTNKVFKVKKSKVQEVFRAYHGAYTVSVFYKNDFVKNVTFYLHPGQDMSVTIPLAYSEIRPVFDFDTEKCDVSGTTGEEDNDDDDDSNPRNTGSSYAKAAAAKKKTKASRRNYIGGRNVKSE